MSAFVNFANKELNTSKFVVASTENDKETLERNGFKKVNEFTRFGTRNYVFINNPLVLQTFNLGNMKLSYTNKLMF